MKNNLHALTLGILVSLLHNAVSLHGMQMLGRKRPLAPTTRPQAEPQSTAPTPTSSLTTSRGTPTRPTTPPPAVPTSPSQPTPPSTTVSTSMSELTPPPAPINRHLSPKKQAIKELMEDFNNKFGTSLFPEIKETLQNTITGIEVTPSTTPPAGRVPMPPAPRETALLPTTQPSSAALEKKMATLDKKLDEIMALIANMPRTEQEQWFELLAPLLEEREAIEQHLAQEELSAAEEKTISSAINDLLNRLIRVKSEISQQKGATKT